MVGRERLARLLHMATMSLETESARRLESPYGRFRSVRAAELSTGKSSARKSNDVIKQSATRDQRR